MSHPMSVVSVVLPTVGCTSLVPATARARAMLAPTQCHEASITITLEPRRARGMRLIVRA